SGKDVLERLFTTFGYKREDNIKIPGLYLDCHWYEPPQSTNWPKLFISEQQVQELPNEAKEIVYSTIGNYYAEDPFFELGLDKPESVDPLALCLALEERPWRTSYRDYQALLALTDKYKPASGALQYTAWTLVHGHRWNHFTILLNTLGVSGLDTLEDLNAFLKENGFPLNKWGERELQGSTERLLKQSSTKANLVEATFSDGVDATVPGSFVEFIERFQGDSGPFRGFLADNARGIFASTNARD
ncbi:MAG: DUF1338 family protein, partial [Chlamydiia bacterium]|nr:DUF1338 family protein [Chlamydiia bacterium]